MSKRPTSLLVVGATGSIGRLSTDRARGLPSGTEAVVGDLTRPESLGTSMDGVDAVVFTHGSQGGKTEMEAVDYGGVRVLTALDAHPARIALRP